MPFLHQQRQSLPSYPQGDLESPFLQGEVLVQEAEPEWGPRLAALQAESSFQRAFEGRLPTIVEPEVGGAEKPSPEVAMPTAEQDPADRKEIEGALDAPESAPLEEDEAEPNKLENSSVSPDEESAAQDLEESPPQLFDAERPESEEEVRQLLTGT
mgnify:CR=1 FL=1